MKKIRRIFLFFYVSVIIFSGAQAASLGVESYDLGGIKYKALKSRHVYRSPLNIHEWIELALKENSDIVLGMKTGKIATIQVKVPNNGDIGSIVPFIKEGQIEAAKLGANVIEVTNEVKGEGPGQIKSITFTAYRVEWKDYILPPDLFDRLKRHMENQEFQKYIKEWNHQEIGDLGYTQSIDKERELKEGVFRGELWGDKKTKIYHLPECPLMKNYKNSSEDIAQYFRQQDFERDQFKPHFECIGRK